MIKYPLCDENSNWYCLLCKSPMWELIWVQLHWVTWYYNQWIHFSFYFLISGPMNAGYQKNWLLICNSIDLMNTTQLWSHGWHCNWVFKRHFHCSIKPADWGYFIMARPLKFTDDICSVLLLFYYEVSYEIWNNAMSNSKKESIVKTMDIRFSRNTMQARKFLSTVIWILWQYP